MTRPGSACESRVPWAFPRFMGDFKIPTLYLTVWMHIIVSMVGGVGMADERKAQALERLRELLKLQNEIESRFGDQKYNIFVFGSYITTRYEAGKSDIDIAVYAEDFELYLQISTYLEDYFNQKGIRSDIFFIDINMKAPFYCAPLNSQIRFTDYYPQKLIDFKKGCQSRLDEIKERMVG